MKILRSAETPTAIISIDENGVGFIHFKDHSHQDIPQQMENLVVLDEITGKIKTPFVVTAGEGVTISKEARHHSLLIEEQSPMMATAVVVQNVAYRLITDFYMKTQRPKNPFAVFTDKNKAYKWCEQFLDKK